MSEVNAKQTMKSFVKQFVAIIEGNDSAVEAQKAFREADSALGSQINNLEGETMVKEDAVEDAVEAVKIARVNGGKRIANKPQYVANLLCAKNVLTAAEEDLELHLKKIAFLKSEKEEISKEVE
jgi:hypothetical protein